VIGECNDDDAVQARSAWGIECGRCCGKKGTAVQKGKTTLRVDVADAMEQLWARDEHGHIPAWTHLALSGLWVAGCLSEDVELRELLEGVAAAGSWGCSQEFGWSYWLLGVSPQSPSYKRARIVTGKISVIISE
jgi:hypothetical protein